MPFSIVRNDITRLRVDAIVNAANPALQRGGGVCGAIFDAAGADTLQAACDRLAPIRTGEAVLTPGFRLPARYIIHTAGPVYRGGQAGEADLLRACYTNALSLALEHGCTRVAFPLISAGIYGYPKAEALRVATAAIRAFLDGHDMDVCLVVFDRESLAVSEALLGEVARFIDENYIAAHATKQRRQLDPESAQMHAEGGFFEQLSAPFHQAPAPTSLDDLVQALDEPFSVTLLRLIDATGQTDAQVYRRANIDRRLFSKIRGNEHYAPSKPTVLALAVALELSLKQTEDLLERAGFALSRSRKFDVIVEYFIRNSRYDIYEINEVLFRYDQPLLGG